ncbi:hypothetical protein PPYR_06232 [Photinus pyralis]|uniref:UBZ1-type domain-containing protein n=1 Tax=Photinus pyralis TaxID=7054 RepID=A0A1Y1KVV5_PHOPY|nr:protein spindle-F [Photinus pyralis]XP_031337880.1 protein spindle-F [Photinus pyralis]KAB0800492.1 hypothetical protein PPYR_06232 [Photinus pyralis]
MEESCGAQYALQIALQTLRERCHQFQQRIAVLEEENLNLRCKASIRSEQADSSLSEVDSLRQQVSQLTEHNLQLTSNVLMVSAENRQLWNRLSRLTRANENLGSKLHKISDTLSNVTLSNSQSTLVRSKTFTQEEPHVKVVPRNVTDENNRISLELEDISLKLMCNIAKEKSELELQCSQMTELQNNEFINTFAFAYSAEEVDNTILDEFDQYLMNLKNIKHVLTQEKGKLQKNLNDLNSLSVYYQSTSVKPPIDKVSTFVQTNAQELVDEVAASAVTNEASKMDTCTKICPMCSKVFKGNVTFREFQDHVENHFTSDTETFDVI